MSYVTNVIITASLFEEDEIANDEFIVPAIDQINAVLTNQGKGTLSRVTAESSGKNLETMIYVGAFNYLGKEEILGIVRAAKWEAPEHVQVFIQRQEENLFALYKIKE